MCASSKEMEKYEMRLNIIICEVMNCSFRDGPHYAL